MSEPFTICSSPAPKQPLRISHPEYSRSTKADAAVERYSIAEIRFVL